MLCVTDAPGVYAAFPWGGYAQEKGATGTRSVYTPTIHKKKAALAGSSRQQINNLWNSVVGISDSDVDQKISYSYDGSSQKATQKRLISEISLFSLVFKRRATGEIAVSSAHRESAKSALFL